MAFRFAFKTSFEHLQDLSARFLACLNNASLKDLADAFLLTGPSQQTITCSKLATGTQKQGVKTI